MNHTAEAAHYRATGAPSIDIRPSNAIVEGCAVVVGTLDAPEQSLVCKGLCHLGCWRGRFVGRQDRFQPRCEFFAAKRCHLELPGTVVERMP